MELVFIIAGVLGLGYWLGKSSGKKEHTPADRAIVSGANNSPPKKLNTEKVDISSIELSEEQKAIYDEIESTNVTAYITGKAGTGKSVLLQYFIGHTSKKAAVVAPTGVAALNVAGQTIHSFFKLDHDIQESQNIRLDYKTKELLRHLDALVIDEISMVRVDIIEAINKKLQLARNTESPFGGVQVIMFGDLFQLPPVVTDGEVSRYFNHTYGGIYFFNAPVIKAAMLRVFELNHIFRQKDNSFIQILNKVREGYRSEELIASLNQRAHVNIPESGYITLAGHNATVSRINHEKLNQLSGASKIYLAEVTGDLKGNSFPTEKELKLKEGAQVMMLKNDKLKPPRWVNGTLGVITKLGDDAIRVNIDGVEHSVSKETWHSVRYFYNPEERKLDKEIISSFTQFPIRLAWAITIHKSQGQTYQSVKIDLSDGAFAHGQTYVALSRCVSLETLYLSSPIKPDDIIVDQDVIEFMSLSKPK